MGKIRREKPRGRLKAVSTGEMCYKKPKALVLAGAYVLMYMAGMVRFDIC